MLNLPSINQKDPLFVCLRTAGDRNSNSTLASAGITGNQYCPIQLQLRFDSLPLSSLKTLTSAGDCKLSAIDDFSSLIIKLVQDLPMVVLVTMKGSHTCHW